MENLHLHILWGEATGENHFFLQIDKTKVV